MEPEVSEYTYRVVGKEDLPKVKGYYTYKDDLDDKTYGIIVSESHRRHIN